MRYLPRELLKKLTAPVYNFAADGSGAKGSGGLALPKQGFVSVARCVGAVTRSSSLDVNQACRLGE
jgi:hypothetical protein